MNNKFNTIDEAIIDLKQGKVIIVCDDENRENEGDFIALADKVTPEMVNFMISQGRGLLCVAVASAIANRLNLHQMVNNNTDTLTTAFTVSVDYKTSTTGISAYERYTTIKQIIANESLAEDFRRPGHIFPLVARNNGVLARPGHTEAAVDLAALCQAPLAGVICEVLNSNGSMARRDELLKLSKQFDLKIITVKQLIHYRKTNDKLVQLNAVAKLPTKFGNFDIYGYTSLIDNEAITVIVKGNPKQFVTPIVRIHSECVTGDTFASLRCDCGEQLQRSLAMIESSGQGVIIYLKQEGRGIGLINKLKAYELQQNGYDTFDANIKLGFQADLREYFIAAQVLKDLGISSIRLLTNNPDKVSELSSYGVEIIERIPIKSEPHQHNELYLATKSKKFGHLF
jgi:3,4-dihydroxy 2-butanone 4-phosphate synthase/GTP cyclohydrolase II